MTSEEYTENELIEDLQYAAASKGINLTYTHKLFFLKLLDYARENGDYCPEGIKILMSIEDLSKCLSISSRMVSQSLKIFKDCGIILRCENKKTFPRSTNVTILKKEYYEKEKG